LKYLKFTYVDAATGISVASHPAENGPVFPPVDGLEFVWARESRYPTDVPEFFGTCPDTSDTQIDGVLGLFSQADWEAMQADEMLARHPVPQMVTMRQGRLALLGAGLLDQVDAALAAIPDATQRRAAQIEWEYAQTIDRPSAWVANLSAALSLTDEQLDALFVAAAAL
jgi:hypothetical protein